MRDVSERVVCAVDVWTRREHGRELSHESVQHRTWTGLQVDCKPRLDALLSEIQYTVHSADTQASHPPETPGAS
jgi:hypothetical protein